MSVFDQNQLSNGCLVNLSKIKKFKTVSIKVFIVRDLDERATLTALLPKVLLRGTANYPTSLKFEQSLEDNYGSRLSARSRKIGEKQLIEVALHMPCAKYLTPEGDNQVYQKGIALLKELLFNPLLVDGYFNPEYVEQEKEVLRREIRSVYSDKEEWALKRCIEISCQDEPYAIPAYGRLADVDEITAENLFNFYQELVEAANIQIYVVGNIENDQIVKILEQNLVWNGQANGIFTYNQPIIKFPEKITEVVETDRVNQGKLAISLRFMRDFCSELIPAFLMYNNILGGGTHSKLFTKVREKHSLAYYVHSHTERSKQMIFIEAGIDPKNYQQAVAIIKQEVAAIQSGDVSQEEFERARVSLINSLWALQDFSGGNIDYYLVGLLSGCSYSTEDMEKYLKDVTVAQVVEVAQQIAIDTIYFLRAPKEGA